MANCAERGEKVLSPIPFVNGSIYDFLHLKTFGNVMPLVAVKLQGILEPFGDMIMTGLPYFDTNQVHQIINISQTSHYVCHLGAILGTVSLKNCKQKKSAFCSLKCQTKPS